MNKDDIFSKILLITLIILNLVIVYIAIFILYNRFLFLKIGHDTTIHLQKVVNTMRFRPFVSPEMLGCASHHWDLTLILFFGPLLKIFNSPLPVIFSSILGPITSIIIFLLFYFTDKRYSLLGFLSSVVYLFNEYIILRSFSPNYADSVLFTIFFAFAMVFFVKKKYNLAIIPLILSYMVNLETIPYQFLLFSSTILIIFGKKMNEDERLAFKKYIIFTIIYILIFHFLLYRWLSRWYDNVFELYYRNRHSEETQTENPIVTLIKNTLYLDNKKLDFVIRSVTYVFPFSLIPSNLFNILMSLSASKRFYENYVGPDTQYHIALPVFTILTLFFYFYYNRPLSKRKLTILYLILFVTLLIKINYIIPMINANYRYAKSLLEDKKLLEKRIELLEISKKYIDFEKSITAPQTVTYLFYTMPLVLPTTQSVFNLEECKIMAGKFSCFDKDPLKTYYILFDITEIEKCNELNLTKNLEKIGYEKIYSGKYFILFKIKNESEAYYGIPLI